MLPQLLATEVFVFFAIFSRIGSAFMLMPTIGESFNNTRSRLAFAIVTSILLFPVISPSIPGLPRNLNGFISVIFSEIFIGLFFGAIMRAVFMIVSVTGTIIAFVTGFSNALVFNPALSDQGILQAVFLTLFATLVVFATDTHHYLLRGLIETYRLFPPNQLPNLGDIAQSFALYFSKSFNIGIQLSTPFIFAALIFFISIGILSRLMPQLQIFFIAMPLQIIIGLFIFILSISSIMAIFIDVLRTSIVSFPNFS
jgi:flagellar biosynthetic protein FliR